MNLRPLIFAGILAATPALAQQPASPPPLVSTSGSALIRVVPDLADLSFEIEVRDSVLATARTQQADRSAKVLAALRAAGVAEAELQSSQVHISPDYTDRRQETEKIRFYRVSQTICCTLRTVSKVPDVTAAAIAAGATGVGDAQLRSTELRKYRDEARAKAIKAAKEKAVALATELDAKVGKPHTITEGAVGSYGDRRVISGNSMTQVAEAGPSPDGASPAFAPGSIDITATVSVSFLLE